jgi:hypothetical protein
VLITYADPASPPAAYTVASLDQVGTRSAWTRLTRPNPQVDAFALGDEEEITWKSTDGTMVGGVLVKRSAVRGGAACVDGGVLVKCGMGEPPHHQCKVSGRASPKRACFGRNTVNSSIPIYFTQTT